MIYHDNAFFLIRQKLQFIKNSTHFILIAQDSYYLRRDSAQKIRIIRVTATSSFHMHIEMPNLFQYSFIT